MEVKAGCNESATLGNATGAAKGGGVISLTNVDKRVVGNSIIIGEAAGGEALLGATIHKCVDEATLASEAIRKYFDGSSGLDSYENLWKERLSKDLSRQLALRWELDRKTDEEIEKLFSDKNETAGEGLANAPLQNILQGL